jgi:hypothetical protein
MAGGIREVEVDSVFGENRYEREHRGREARRNVDLRHFGRPRK